MGFEFKKKENISINGKEYPFDAGNIGFMEAVVDYYPKVIEALASVASHRDELNELFALSRSPDTSEQVKTETLDKIQAMTIEFKNKNREAFDHMVHFIQGSIGDTEYQEIFEGQKDNFDDHYALCDHIYQFAYKAREGVIREFMAPEGKPMPATNRAQKRAKNKQLQGSPKDATRITG